MSKRKSPDADVQPHGRLPWRLWFLQVSLLTGIVAVLIGGLTWLGHYARQQLRDSERYQLIFVDVDCVPPPGLTREDFLDEVKYFTPALQDRFSIFDDALADKMTQAFEKHPWVEHVDRVAIQPPKTVKVLLAYRRPLLAVVVPKELAGPGFEGGENKLPLRAMDKHGVLLPKKALLPRGLLILDQALPPTKPAGQPWGDARVEGTARTAELLHSHQHLKLTWMTLTPTGLILWGPRVKVLWGEPAGLEKKEDPSAAVKLQRLVEAMAQRESLAPPWMHEFDLRPAGAVSKRLVVEGK